MKGRFALLGGLAVAVLTAVVAVVLNFVGVFAFRSADGRDVAADISAALSNSAGATVRVTCPREIPMRRGGIEDCEATAGTGTTIVRVVQDDSRGHYHYTVNEPAVLRQAGGPPDTPPPPVPVIDTSDDPPMDECARADPDLLGTIVSRPAPGVGQLLLPSGYTLNGKRGVVVGGFLSSAATAGSVDGEFGTWFVAADTGTIYAYTDAARTRTAWPTTPAGEQTDLTRRVRRCAAANAG